MSRIASKPAPSSHDFPSAVPGSQVPVLSGVWLDLGRMGIRLVNQAPTDLSKRPRHLHMLGVACICWGFNSQCFLRVDSGGSRIPVKVASRE